MDTQFKVVLIEDEVLLLRMYQEKLEKDGIVVFTATDGTEGMQLLNDELPSIVLCDIMMPGTNGLEFLKMKQASDRPEVRDIPVIMLSNLDDEQIISEARELGAIDFIEKSKSDPQDVVARIKQMTKLSQANDQA